MGSCCTKSETLPDAFREVQAVGVGRTGLVIMGSNTSRDCFWLDVKKDDDVWRVCGKFQSLQPHGHLTFNFKDERMWYQNEHSGELECVNEFVVSTGGASTHVELCRVDKQRRRLIEWYSLNTDETRNILGVGTVGCVFQKRFIAFVGGHKATRHLSVFEFRPDMVPPMVPCCKPKPEADEFSDDGSEDTDDKKIAEEQLEAALKKTTDIRRRLVSEIDNGSALIFKRVYLNLSKLFPSSQKWVSDHGLVYLQRCNEFFLFNDHFARLLKLQLPSHPLPTLGPKRKTTFFDMPSCALCDEEGVDEHHICATTDAHTHKHRHEHEHVHDYDPDDDRLVIPEEDENEIKPKDTDDDLLTPPPESGPLMMQTVSSSDARSVDDLSGLKQFERCPPEVFDMELPAPIQEMDGDIQVTKNEMLDSEQFSLPCAVTFEGYAFLSIYDCVFVFGGSVDESLTARERSFSDDVERGNVTDMILGLDPFWDYSAEDEDGYDSDAKKKKKELAVAKSSPKNRWRRMTATLSSPMSDCVAILKGNKVHVLGSDDKDARCSVPVSALGITPRAAEVVADHMWADALEEAGEDVVDAGHLPEEIRALLASFCPFMHLF